MNYFVGVAVLYVSFMYAVGYTFPHDGCTRMENRSGCYFDVDCVGYIENDISDYMFQPKSYGRRIGYVDNGNYYDENGMIIPSESEPDCPSENFIYYNGNKYNKIHLKYKSTDSNPEDMEGIPRTCISLCFLIVHLDLSNNEYSTNAPHLREMKHLTFLNLSNNYLTTATLYNTVELPALTDIDLSYNMINSIDVTSADPLYRSLQKLNMSHNYLVEIPDAVFDAFTLLETLDLSHNYIDRLSISTFEGIKKLNSLFLSHNRITDINYSFFRFSDLTTLDLSFNRIVSLKIQDFEKLTKLKTIDFSSNNLVTIESSVFGNMHALESINLRDNKLKVINKDTFANAIRLKHVDLTLNSFDVLPRGLFKGKKVNRFDIKGNRLEGSLTSGTFDGLGLVVILDLSHQRLTTIEDNAFLGLDILETLLLNNNEIQTLSRNCFRSLRNLHTLNLSNNNITDINFDAQDLINLRSILLNNNFLTQIKHENFQGLGRLQFLDLSNNKISKLESNSFKSLRDLINFEVSNNPLTGSLEEKTFDGLNSLPSLVISSTQLTTIKNGSFIGMTQLKELNMSQSKISELQYNAFVNTGAIEVIDISYNQLRIFDVNSTELVNLRVLLLNKNILKTISQSTFLGFSSVTQINLAHNNIKEIGNDVFESQTELVTLDLSYNLDITFNEAIVSKNLNLRNLLLSGVRNGITFTRIEGTQLTDLEICFSGLSNITAIHLKELSRLENINLSNNDVVKLEVGAFTNVTQLRSLDMSHNKLMFIQPGVFKDTTRLHFLNISHNSLTDISYGIFRGLIFLNTLDMSYNAIASLESERFYEVQSLSTLIADHNKINSLSAEDFVGTRLNKLSIGGNPLPCEILVNFKKNSVSFIVTAINIDEHTGENVDGVTCNMNGYKYKTTSITTNSDETARILVDIKDVLTKFIKQHQHDPIKNISNESVADEHNFEYFINISRQIDKISSESNDIILKFENTTSGLAKGTGMTNVLLEKILSTLNRKYVAQTTPFPISKDNASDNLISYINKVKNDMEAALAAEKLNIVDEMERKMANFATANLVTSSTVTPKSPIHDKLMAARENVEANNTNTSSLFTETCVALILVILVCFVLYKFYKSRMFVGARRSYSTRDLPGAMESQNL